MRRLSNTTLEVEGRKYPLDWIRLDSCQHSSQTILYDSENIPRLCFLVNQDEQEVIIYAGECGLLNISINNIPELVKELNEMYEVYSR